MFIADVADRNETVPWAKGLRSRKVSRTALPSS